MQENLLDIHDEQPCYSPHFVVPTNKDVGADRVPPEAGKPGYRAVMIRYLSGILILESSKREIRAHIYVETPLDLCREDHRNL